MHYSKTIYLATLLASAALTSAAPGKRLPGGLEVRVVDELNEEATAEAHQRDNTATRAFSSITITNGDGECLFVDPLSGDFRANLLPVQSRACDGGDDQKWDIITAGLHNDQPGTMLVVSALTQGCLNYDPRRQPGDQVNIFSCGGRAAGEGKVTNSQLFSFPEVKAGPLSLQPLNEAGTCVTLGATRLDKAACNAADQKQSFTFGAAAAAGGNQGGNTATEAPATEAPTATTAAPAVSSVAGGIIGTEDGFSTIPFPGSTGAPAPPAVTTTVEDITTAITTTAADGPATTSFRTVVEITSVTVLPTETAVGEAPAPTQTDRGQGRGRGGRGRGRGGRGRGRASRRPCPKKDD